jgi:hypothetical protein
MLPKFYACGCCGGYHNINLPDWVDCRDDSNRFTAEQLDDLYGVGLWEEVQDPHIDETE